MSYSRNKYRCLLKPHNQNVIVSHDNNIQSNYRYPCIYSDGPYYPGYPCIKPEPYINQQNPQNLEQNQSHQSQGQDKPFPIPHVYPYGPYGGYGPYGSYGPYGGYGPYRGYLGHYPYSQKIKEKLKSKNENVKNENVKNENVGNENIGNENIGNMKPHCEYYSSSSDSDDSDDYRCYRRYRRRHAVAPETNDLESNRVFDEQNQKPYPIPKPRPKPKNENSQHKEDEITNSVIDKKSFAKPLAKLFTKFTTPEKEPDVEQIQVVEDEKKEKNLIFLKV
jgi:hypothetical protein